MRYFPFPVNWPIAYLAAWFWLCETLYFGLNWTPDSAAEVIADGIVFLLAALALAFGTPVKPRITIHRVLGPERKCLGITVMHNGDVDVIKSQDLSL